MYSKELQQLYRKFNKAKKEMAGCPASQFFNYSQLHRFLKFHVNNLGDPFVGNFIYRLNTHDLEKKVITRFAHLFFAPQDDFWGYVTNGGTEGNFYGLYVARELHPDGVVFYSDQTHYSIPKCLHILRMPSVKIQSLENGEMDYEALRSALSSAKSPPIILANIGTTMKGAIDDILQIKRILADLKIKKHYIHCDAAFFGMILPFLPEAEQHAFDFRTGIDSIAVSGHKMIGTPVPCGVVITKRSHLEFISTHIEYTGTKDNTITGSRSGITPLFLWQELQESQHGNMEKKVRGCLENADYAMKRFHAMGIRAWRNKNSIIIVFPRPSEKTVKKWQLAVEKDIAHLITLPHLAHKTIDRIVSEVDRDLKKKPKGKKRDLPTILP